jgi:hypothetical protein
MDSARVINILGPCAGIDDSVGVCIFRWVNVAIPDTSQNGVVLLVGPVEVRHGLVTLVEEHECPTQSFVWQTTDVLVHASLCSRQEPQYSLDDKVGDEPA